MAAFEGKADICSIKTSWTAAKAPKAAQAYCREPEVRPTIAASPVANVGFKAALESYIC
jgi:hypothetical protein